MIELLIALFLKFWMFLFGGIRGVISAVPFLRRLMLSSNLESEMHDGHLLLHAGRRDLMLTGLHIIAIEDIRIVVVETGELLLAAGQTHRYALPGGVRICILMTELVDLRSGRRARVHRRIEAGHVSEDETPW